MFLDPGMKIKTNNDHGNNHGEKEREKNESYPEIG